MLPWQKLNSEHLEKRRSNTFRWVERQDMTQWTANVLSRVRKVTRDGADVLFPFQWYYHYGPIFYLIFSQLWEVLKPRDP